MLALHSSRISAGKGILNYDDGTWKMDYLNNAFPLDEFYSVERSGCMSNTHTATKKIYHLGPVTYTTQITQISLLYVNISEIIMSKISFARSGNNFLIFVCFLREKERGRGPSLSTCQVPLKNYPLKRLMYQDWYSFGRFQ